MSKFKIGCRIVKFTGYPEKIVDFRGTVINKEGDILEVKIDDGEVKKVNRTRENIKLEDD